MDRNVFGSFALDTTKRDVPPRPSHSVDWTTFNQFLAWQEFQRTEQQQKEQPVSQPVFPPRPHDSIVPPTRPTPTFTTPMKDVDKELSTLALEKSSEGKKKKKKRDKLSSNSSSDSDLSSSKLSSDTDSAEDKKKKKKKRKRRKLKKIMKEYKKLKKDKKKEEKKEVSKQQEISTATDEEDKQSIPETFQTPRTSQRSETVTPASSGSSKKAM